MQQQRLDYMPNYIELASGMVIDEGKLAAIVRCSSVSAFVVGS